MTRFPDSKPIPNSPDAAADITASGACSDDVMDELELTVLMPSLDEAETIEVCIEKALGFIARAGIKGEVLISDNGSTDGSQVLAEKAGARVVHVPMRGYGAALRGGIAAARGKYIIMGDSDDSYDFSDLSLYMERLRAGDELVMGNRFKGGIAPGAMPNLHRYLGNPGLTLAGRILFGCPIGDSQCGLRGFSKKAINELGLRGDGMEFASEMVVKATLYNLKIGEVPTTLSPDGRSRPPHLRSWRDGSRILAFLLIHSPRWTFLAPGLALMLLGLTLGAVTMPGPFRILGVTLDVHTLAVASGMVVLGSQMLTFGVFTKMYGVSSGVFPVNARQKWIIRFFSAKRAYTLGGLSLLAGLGAMVYALVSWGATGLGDLDYTKTMRIVLPAVTGAVVGAQLILSGLMSSIIDLRATRE